MAFRELPMVEIKDLLRRLQAGHSLRAIARQTGVDRKTMRRYVDALAARQIDLASVDIDDSLIGQLVRDVQVRTAPSVSDERRRLLEHKAVIDGWLSDDKEPLTLTKVHTLLQRRGVEVSYPTLRRFAQSELGWRKKQPTVRLDDPPPGQEAQIDFGKMGTWTDPITQKRRSIWALIVTLSYSRDQFVYPTFDQKLETVVAGLDAAWHYFGGVVARAVIDNLKPAILKADAQDPVVNPAFLEYAESRGFFVDAARARRPKDKPRVENQVRFVRQSWFRGETFTDLQHMRREAAAWCSDVAGQRCHGTTRRKPREVLLVDERPHLRPCPAEPFDIPTWTTAKVHPDHHIQVKKALYSVPTQYVGREVKVRIDTQLVRVYWRGDAIKTHPVVPPGARRTDINDYPEHKRPYADRSARTIRKQARDLDPVLGDFVDRLLDDPMPWRFMRQAQALIAATKRFGTTDVAGACRRALDFDVIDGHRVLRILRSTHRIQEAASRSSNVLPFPRFARSQLEFRTMERGEEDV